MDEDVTCLIQRACELARSLESNLPVRESSSDSVLRCIDEIVMKLNAAKRKLLVGDDEEAAAKQEIIQQPPQQPQIIASSSSSASSLLFPEWLSVSHQLHQMPQVQPPARTTTLTAPRPRGTGLQIMTDFGARNVDASSAEVDAVASPSRRRKRKDESEKTTVMVAANQFGNADVPPEDGYTWRKYGQKEILGSNYPRSYFRCTHQKLCQCPAKKQVQRLDSNPNIFAVTYRGSHTCHLSSTAPSSSVVPPPQLIISQSHPITPTTSSQLSPSSSSVPGWLSSVHLGLLTAAGGGGMNPAGAEVPTSRLGADYPVADMADAMFNSGSSSGNSMESLFTSADEKWEQAGRGDNKKT